MASMSITARWVRSRCSSDDDARQSVQARHRQWPTPDRLLAGAGQPLYGGTLRDRRARLAVVRLRTCPNDVPLLLSRLQAVAPYRAHPVARIPNQDPSLIKRYLDIGGQTLLVPYVESAAQAEALGRATRYPPNGVRGVAGGLVRASRWGRSPIISPAPMTRFASSCRSRARLDRNRQLRSPRSTASMACSSAKPI